MSLQCIHPPIIYGCIYKGATNCAIVPYILYQNQQVYFRITNARQLAYQVYYRSKFILPHRVRGLGYVYHGNTPCQEREGICIQPRCMRFSAEIYLISKKWQKLSKQYIYREKSENFNTSKYRGLPPGNETLLQSNYVKIRSNL